MADETAEIQPDTIEHITVENMDSTANVRDPTKPHDATIPEPERDATMPDDPTSQHESARHAHVPHGPGHEQAIPGAATAGVGANDADAADDHGKHGHAAGKAGAEAAAEQSPTGHGPGHDPHDGKPRLTAEEQKQAMDLLDKSLQKVDFAWESKKGNQRDLGHQSYIHMERAFIAAAYADKGEAGKLFQKYAGRPPSEALMKRVDGMSRTNINATIADLNHGINAVDKKRKHAEVSEMVESWKEGAKQSSKDFRRARGQLIDDVLEQKNHHEHEHGQFIMKAAWRGVGSRKNISEMVGKKYGQAKDLVKLLIGARKHGKEATNEAKFSVHTDGHDLESAVAAAKKNMSLTANDNQVGAKGSAGPARTTGRTGAIFDKFKGVAPAAKSANAKVQVGQAAARAMKRTIDAVGRGVNRVLDTVSVDAAKKAQAPQQQAERGAAAPKIELGSKVADDAQRKQNIARQAAMSQGQGIGQGM